MALGNENSSLRLVPMITNDLTAWKMRYTGGALLLIYSPGEPDVTGRIPHVTNNKTRFFCRRREKRTLFIAAAVALAAITFTTAFSAVSEDNLHPANNQTVHELRTSRWFHPLPSSTMAEFHVG